MQRLGRDLLLLSRKAVGIPVVMAEDFSLNGEFLGVARSHRLGALIGKGASSEIAVEPQVQAELQALKASAIGQALEMDLMHTTLFKEYRAALGAGHIKEPMIVLKGGHLRKTVYADAPYLREMSDLDVLVSHKDFEAYRTLLRGLGLKKAGAPAPEFHLAMKHDEAWATQLPSGRIFKVDVHRNLIDRLRAPPPVENLFANSIPLPGEPDLRGLSPLHCAAHCALHLGTDDFSGGFRGLVDLDLVVQSEALHPDLFDTEDPVVLRAGAALFLAFSILHAFLEGTDDRYAEFVEKVRVGAIRGRLLSRSLDFNQFIYGVAGPREALRKLLIQIALIQSAPHRWAYPCYQAGIMSYKRLKTQIPFLSRLFS